MLKLILFCQLLSILIEILLTLSPWLWVKRGFLIFIICGLAAFSLPAAAHINGLVVGSLIIFISFYRFFNLFRIIEGRMHKVYLLRVFRRSASFYWIFLLMISGFNLMNHSLVINANNLIWPVILGQITTAIIMIISIRQKILAAGNLIPENKLLSDRQLPTVSLLIPARNETEELRQCLESALSSDYPKLEIIVYDDCSSPKTPEIIRQFANDGVRFIAGQKPQNHWLGKNQACQLLAEQATGDILIFCDVDIRMNASSIRQFINYQQLGHWQMICVVPKVNTSNASNAQVMRYWWELAIPRKIFARPPITNSFWLITSQQLKKLGGFEAVTRNIMPEGYFAKETAKSRAYQLLFTSNDFKIISQKNVSDQLQTAIRVRYPQIHRRPEIAAVITLINIFLLLGPFWMALLFIFMSQWLMFLSEIVIIYLLFACHWQILKKIVENLSFKMLIKLPMAFGGELLVGYTSMFSYEFADVYWKTRNICLPQMHVYPSLPKLPPSRSRIVN